MQILVNFLKWLYKFVVGNDIIILGGVLLVSVLIGLASNANFGSIPVGILFFVGVVAVLTLSLSRELPN